MSTDTPQKRAPHRPDPEEPHGAPEPAPAQELKITQDVLPSGLPLMPSGMARRIAALARLGRRPTR
jgi:hypothetical protein